MTRLLALSLLILVAGCADGSKPGQGAPVLGATRTDTIRFVFAVYFLPRLEGDPNSLLQAALGEAKGVGVVDDIPARVTEPVVAAHVVADVRKNYVPPDLRSLQYFARGLSKEQAQSLQGSEQALVLEFAHPASVALPALATATRVAAAVAKASGGILWDEETREAFSAEAWNESRVFDAMSGVPAVRAHTIIHAYKSGDGVRAITLGMKKFGLPDLVINDSSWEMNRPIGNLIVAVSQRMIEGAAVPLAGDFDLDLAAIGNPVVRSNQIDEQHPNATGHASLSLSMTAAEEGDPDNRLLAIGFDRYKGADVHAREHACVAALYGWSETVNRVRRSDTLRAESERQRAKLPALRARFNAGLAPGEFIDLKAPFERDGGGTEWMWVEVASWKEAAVTGMLRNEPEDIADLHGGTEVEVEEGDVFDFLIRHKDGSVEGNTTGPMIEALQREQAGDGAK